MRISHDRKFVFLSLPRAASLTVRKALNPYSDIKSKRKSDITHTNPFWHHTRACEAKEIFEEKNWSWGNYRTFCFVRNPYDRVVSAYKRRWEENYGWHSTGRPVRDVKSFLRDVFFKPIPFEAFVRESNPEKGYSISIYNFTHDSEDNCLVDDILKFENLPENLVDYLGFELEISIDRRSVGHYHKSESRKKYKSYHTEKTKRIIRRQYRMEIEEFGYGF
ncbi:sulfotransferase family protein [Salinibacter ruber]|uniref:sulfotransferase family protein n=1 Tax=Salinibacter ruber TaxID=146919 RepID=UPI0021675E05|nr:sulfotransferase family protein [Salinibacter ruber]MCS3697419.1 hypothetical protein [Salinibacter ruber]